MSEKIDIRKIKELKSSKNHYPKKKLDKENDFWKFLNRDIRFSRYTLSDRIKESFYMELWSLLEAGVDIRTALDLVKEGHRKTKVKNVFADVQKMVVEGTTFSNALKNSKEFSSYEYYTIKIGEETGKLLLVLKELSEYYGKKIKQRRQIISAITYPIVVMLVAFAAVGFMVAFVVPMFSDTFKRFGSDLPSLTKAVISISAFIKQFIGLFILFFCGLVVFCIWQSKRVWFRKLSAAILLKTPVIGKIIHMVYLARFTNTMSLLIGAKIPMIQAIQLVKKMIVFYPIEISLDAVEKSIVNGNSFNKSLGEHSIYPSKMVSIIQVGEEVNQLELFFTRLSVQYASDVEYQTTMLSKFLEPFIIIFLGLVVGIILIAMYLPMFKLGQTF